MLVFTGDDMVMTICWAVAESPQNTMPTLPLASWMSSECIPAPWVMVALNGPL